MATEPIGHYTITKNTAAQWTSNDPILARSELGIERDTTFFKIGDGLRSWKQLPYVMSPTSRGLIVFVSEDPDNLLEYGKDGGFKLVGEYFNGVPDYELGKGNDPFTTTPTRRYHQTIFTIGREIKEILIEIANLKHVQSLQPNAIGINDQSNSSASTTWSTAKIVDALVNLTLEIKADLLGNHQAAYDALVQLANYLETDPNLATSLATELESKVSYEAIQTLTSSQKAQARDNIGAASVAALGESIDVVALYNQTIGNTAGSLIIESEV